MPEDALEDSTRLSGNGSKDQPVNLQISNLVVRLTAEYTGRGPTRAKTTISDVMVTVLLEDILTKGEKSLVRDGMADQVLQTRHAYQMTMRDELVEGVERLV